MNKYLAIGVAALIPVTTGCGAIIDKVAEKATEEVLEEVIEGDSGAEVEIDADSGQIIIKGEDGEVIEFNADEENGTVEITDGDGETLFTTGDDIVDGWPSDYPVPSGLTVITSSKISDPDTGTTAYSIFFEGDGDIDQILGDIESTLDGREPMSDITSTTDGDTFVSRTYDLGDDLIINILLTEDDGKLSGSYSVIGYKG